MVSKSNSSLKSRRRPESTTTDPLDIDPAIFDPTLRANGTSDRGGPLRLRCPMSGFRRTPVLSR